MEVSISERNTPAMKGADSTILEGYILPNDEVGNSNTTCTTYS